MSSGLPVSRLIAVSVTLSPLGAQFANLQSALFLSDTDVIDVGQRFRTYASAAAIAADLGNTDPAYLAAVDFFAQSPSPTQVYVGKWAQANVAGRLIGGALTALQQALSNFTGITTGSLKLAIDGGGPTTLTGLNFSAVTNMNGVAAIINTALASAATCTWDGSHFIIKSATAGGASSVGFATAPGSGTDIKALINATQALGARSVNGIVAESALTAVQVLDALPGLFFYGLVVTSTHVVDADHIAIAAYIEGDSLGPHVYFLTAQSALVPDPTQSGDIASVLTAAGYKRSGGQWCSTDPYAVASLLASAITVNYTGSNTVKNLMYQPEPGITPESLTLAQANAMDAKRINYSATYNNGVAVLGAGVMFGAAYIDEITGTDWLANYIQTNVFNLLATIGTKVAQTDAGEALIMNVIEKSMAQAVANGLVAPGTWTAGGFGQLATGDFLAKGYYIYAPPMASQAPADRAARKATPIQIAAKLAGAIDTANIAISVNR